MATRARFVSLRLSPNVGVFLLSFGGMCVTGILIVVVALLMVFGVSWHHDKRTMLNAGIFGLLLAFVYLLFLEVAFRSDWSGGLYAYMTIALFIGAPLVYLLGSALLILNGRTMIRNEGLSLSHLLSPLIGGIPVLLLFAVIGLAGTQFIGGDELFAIGSLLLMVSIGIYGYLLWTAYCTIPYAMLYTMLPKKPDAAYIIVHGSGLIDGKIPPLLKSRLDKAIEVYNAGGGRATIIPSGGQGPDEPRAEAVAMAEYLLDRSIPANKIVPEDQSTTTRENMMFSKSIIEERSTNAGKILFVTSNYHVFRIALIARRVGLSAHGIGSRTARYYLPSAIIREFIAITVKYKWWHIIPIGLGAAGMGLLVLVSLSL